MVAAFWSPVSQPFQSFFTHIGRSRYAKEYDDALIFKTFVFQFANAYFAMYLLRGILA